jgi:hypothetical protein
MPKLEKRKPGRPKLEAHEAKGKIVPVRFAAEELEKIQDAANSAGQTISQWIRATLSEAVQ